MTTSEIFRTMLIPARFAKLADHVATTLAPKSGQGMWRIGLAENSESLPSHVYESGFIGPEWGEILPLKTYEFINGSWQLTSESPGQPEHLVSMLISLGSDVTLDQIQDLFDHADVTQQTEEQMLQRTGLTHCSPTDGDESL